MRQLKITKQVTNRETASLDKYLQEIGRVDLITAEEEVELGVYDQVVEKTPEDYEELEKVTTLAVNEFVDGDIEWTHDEEEAV